MPIRRSEVPPEAIAAYEEKHKPINRKILERVASEPGFKERLLENWKEALQDIGVAEELEKLRDREVTGHGHYGTYCCDYYSEMWCEWWD